MIENLPAPLTPADCDLQDFKFMPVDCARLHSSEQNSDVTPEANWAAMLLWTASWHEVPAASIPDNDQWIAKKAGYVARGDIDPRWNAVRDGALRKFIRCSDGRLYHPVVAEKAIEAWGAKLQQRWMSECGRIKKHNQRHDLKGAEAVQALSYEEWLNAGRPQGHPLPVPRDTPPVSPGTKAPVPGDVPGDKGSKRQGQGQRQGQRISNTPPSGVTGGGKAEARQDQGPAAPPPAPPAPTPATLPPAPAPAPLPAVEPPPPAPRSLRKCPPDFKVTADLVTWAGTECPLLSMQVLKRESAAFRDFTFSSGKSDWAATWRNWMRKAQKDAEKDAGKGGETAYQRTQRERVSAFTGGLASSPSTHQQEVFDDEPTTPASLDR